MALDLLFWSFLVVLAVTSLVQRNLYASVFILSGYSLVMCLVWTRLNAVDVAFTEAAVGAGVSTVFALAAILRTATRENSNPDKNPLHLIIAAAVAGLLIYGAADLPDYGDPQAPMHTRVAPRYIENTYEEAGVINMVTAVLAYYRGYDTFGETTVVFTAIAAVAFILRRREEET